MEQRLNLKQSQTLTMTPQLQQAIKLLQMSNIELQEYVETELIQNPLLKRDGGSENNESLLEGEQKTSSAKEWEDVQNIAEQLKKIDDRRRNDHTSEKDEWVSDMDKNLETNFENVFTSNSLSDKENSHLDSKDNATFDMSESSVLFGAGGSMNFDSSDYSLENRISDEKNLFEHLSEQMFLEIADAKDRMVGISFIDSLDESGYMRKDISKVAKDIGCSEERCSRVLTQMKKLQPTGVFASSLQECLELQLRESNRFDPAMELLLNNLNMLASHDLKKLARVCRVDNDDLQDMINEIRSLNPRPISEFDGFIVQTVISDAFMKRLPKDKGGGWAVELNNDTLPRVLVNNRYYTEIKKTACKKEDKEYLSERMSSAKWLVKALDQRANTILKVSAEIVKRQESFFTYGVEYLKPMVLKDIAEAIDMHESTISRVTNNKYISTPRGVFELKYFFTRALSSANKGEVDHSTESVKMKIKQLIDDEDPKKILSDDKLVGMLKDAGMNVARRTVAKYRDIMKIPSSVQRRREKNLR